MTMTPTHAKLGLALAALAMLAEAPAVLAQPASPPAAQASSAGAHLTTHVLDTVSGRPASGVPITFEVADGAGWRTLKTLATNADGRTGEPLLAGEAMAAGRYRIVFHVGEYFARIGTPLANPPFLDQIPVEFAIADPKANYHVPLLVTPWSYATYRGS